MPDSIGGQHDLHLLTWQPTVQSCCLMQGFEIAAGHEQSYQLMHGEARHVAGQAVVLVNYFCYSSRAFRTKLSLACQKLLPTSSQWQHQPCTMRSGSTAKVLAKCKLEFYRVSGCLGLRQHPEEVELVAEPIWLLQEEAGKADTGDWGRGPDKG